MDFIRKYHVFENTECLWGSVDVVHIHGSVDVHIFEAWSVSPRFVS